MPPLLLLLVRGLQVGCLPLLLLLLLLVHGLQAGILLLLL